MKHGKKIAAMLAVVAIMAFSGSAIAYGGKYHGKGQWGWNHGRQMMGPGGQGFCQGWSGGGYGPGGQGGPGFCQGGQWSGQGGPKYFKGSGGFKGGQRFGGNFNIPQEIRDKMTEADKLRIDLRAEMTRDKPDKARALEAWKKHRALRNEIAEWMFNQRLEYALNPPAPSAPTDAPAPPKN